MRSDGRRLKNNQSAAGASQSGRNLDAAPSRQNPAWSTSDSVISVNPLTSRYRSSADEATWRRRYLAEDWNAAT